MEHTSQKMVIKSQQKENEAKKWEGEVP